jgi:hypothetical protein
MHDATSDAILRVKNYTLLSLQNQIVEKNSQDIDLCYYF